MFVIKFQITIEWCWMFSYTKLKTTVLKGRGKYVRLSVKCVPGL